MFSWYSLYKEVMKKMKRRNEVVYGKVILTGIRTVNA